jgi:arylsulfatase A-like enzyme
LNVTSAPDPAIGGDNGATQPNIIVFLADTLRADHLGCYGYPSETTPFLDELAQEGVVFEQYVSSSTWTKPALGTMFTGVPPRVHQANIDSGIDINANAPQKNQVQILKDRFITLAETLRELGYSTGYLQANVHGRLEAGYGQGFDFSRIEPECDGAEQVTDAIDWICAHATEPYFLFLHELDPHGPYRPTEDAFFRVHGKSVEAVRVEMDPEEADRIDRLIALYGQKDRRPNLAALSPAAVSYYRMLYDGEIRDVDGYVRRLVNALKRKKRFENTIFVFTSDHGEGFREHGFFGHSLPLPYNELLHVPLIMTGGRLSKGARISNVVSMLDFYPTIVELAGGQSPSYVSGVPILTQSGEIASQRTHTAFSDLDGRRARTDLWDVALTTDQYRVATHQEADTYRIFDRNDDPLEQENLFGAGKLSTTTENDLIARLHQETERYDQLSQQFGEPVWFDSTSATEENLRALGYL